MNSELTFLIADDDSIYLELMTGVLKNFKYKHFIYAKDGQECLEKYSPTVDIVFLDIHMKHKLGFEVLEDIIKFNKDAFIVMMTSDREFETFDKCISLGASGYLCKPFKDSEVQELIELYKSKNGIKTVGDGETKKTIEPPKPVQDNKPKLQKSVVNEQKPVETKPVAPVPTRALSPIEALIDKFMMPAQLDIVLQVKHELNTPDPDIYELSKLIANDVSLTASFIKVANSPIYLHVKHSDVPYKSIDEIIQSFGIPRTRQVVDTIFLLEKSNQHVGLSRFWDSAADVAIISAFIAQRLSYLEPDEVYLTGLFRDCGIPVMMDGIEGYKEFLKEANHDHRLSLREQEEAQFQLNHQTVGYHLCHKWNLPEVICQAILHCHRFDEANYHDNDALDAKIRFLISAVEVAEHISDKFHSLTRPNDDASDWFNLHSNIVNFLETDESFLFNLMDEALEDFEVILEEHRR